MNPQIEARTKDVAHYVIFRAPPEQLGAVKLNKVMWYADLEAYRRRGRTITGQTSYQKQKLGPVPNGIVDAVRRLNYANLVITRDAPTPIGMRREYVWKVRPTLDGFNAEEIDILNEAIDWACRSHTARSISDLSHDALWKAFEVGEQIPIGAASVVPDDIDAADVQWALGELVKLDA